jgi:hypothetical protein
MHYLSSVYFIHQHLHVSDIFVAHHQEVYYIYIYTIGTCCGFQLTVCWPAGQVGFYYTDGFSIFVSNALKYNPSNIYGMEVRGIEV